MLLHKAREVDDVRWFARPKRTWLLLVLMVSLLAGCDFPRPEPGPTPWSGPNKHPERLRKTHHRWNNSNDSTLWDEGDGPLSAYERIKDLQSAIPDNVIELLSSTREVPLHNSIDGKLIKEPPDEVLMWNQPIYAYIATVVSLKPDVMIITMRKRSEEVFSEYPFEDWRKKHGDGFSEGVATFLGEDRLLRVNAGTRLPASDEMYVISTDANIESDLLNFEGDRAVIEFPSGRLIVNRDGVNAEVVRE